MTNHIDHANEARALLISADGDVSMNWPAMTGEYKSDVLAAAQVHATLALAEQARIANLTALAALVDQPTTHESLSDAAYGALDALVSTVVGGVAASLSPDIAAALGIETGASDD